MGTVAYDIQAGARRLEASFPLHTEEGVRNFLEKITSLEELKYFSGDFDVVVWLADFYEAIWNVGLSEGEMKCIYFLFFEGYTQKELVDYLGLKKNTIHTWLTRATRKIALYFENIRQLEEGELA